MDTDFPPGPWRGFWTRADDSFRHLMVLQVIQAGPRFVAEGEDSEGRFTLGGELGPRGESRSWAKSHPDGRPLRFEATPVGESTGIVGRWFRDEESGEFALWPGTSEQHPPALLAALPTESVPFQCVCGETLELPAEAPGMEMECPWCSKTVVAPASGGWATLAEPKPPPVDPQACARCGECGSPETGMSSSCVLCGASLIAPEAFELLSAATDQEVVAPVIADRILRKFAWLIRTQGQPETLHRPLLFPTRDWWPEVWVPGGDSAVALLGALQRGAGLENYSLDLRLLEAEEEAAREELPGTPEGAVCIYLPPSRTGRSVIATGAASLKDRAYLAGLLSHGLGHLSLDQRLKTQAPHPPDLEDLVDLTSVTLGLGIFLCETAFRFPSQVTLTEAELTFAMALWCRSGGVAVEEVPRHLSARGKGHFKEAWRFFEDRPDLVSTLRAGSIEPA